MTPETLSTLGAERLAQLLAEACENDRALRRKVEILLAAGKGGDKLAGALAKRIGTLARARGFVDWRGVRALAAELGALRDGIVAQLGAADPRAAAELMWRFLAGAKATVERVDDSNGLIGDEFGGAANELGRLLARVPDLDRKALAERIHESLGHDEYGFVARLIKSATEALGTEGRAQLRQLLKADLGRLPAREENEDWRTVGWPRARLAAYLADLADSEGDVDAYIEAVRLGGREETLAADVAQRLIAAGRPQEAFDWLDRDRRARGAFDLGIADLRIAAFEALGRKAEAQALRWSAFEETLSAPHLREHLKRLPDFEDFETEHRALAHAAAFADAITALQFLVEWPALEAADRLVRRRIAEIDGRQYGPLGQAAERLSEKWPVSATLLYRVLVLGVLERALSKAYPHAARDLASAAILGSRLTADSGIPGHDAFHAELKAKHGRKYGFWQIVEAGPRGAHR